MSYSKRRNKSIAGLLMVVMGAQLLWPNKALALTTGPSQPEVQGFEPVGTTEMVDMFSGSFVYNIPLLDVEGYPVNISYHGGITMEQESSWVGLGWNINPGVINRTVRGVPDDFNGDTLHRELHIKDEKTLRVGLGAGMEIVGSGDPSLFGGSLGIGTNLNISNYRGVSCDFSFSCGVNLCHVASAGINIGVGSQTGAEIDYNKGISLSTSLLVGKDFGSVGICNGENYNTRTGLKDFSSFSVTGRNQYSSSSITVTHDIPIGIKNYVPVITNSSTMSAISGRLKVGGEMTWCFPYGTINGSFSKLHYNNDGSRPSYGYLNLQNAPDDHNAILDFTRDKDGLFNRTMQYLPPANMTYDIYNVSGQGTGGVFRPFRNDFMSVYDPSIYNNETTNSIGLEAGIGNIFSVGFDATESGTEITSGPWMKYLRKGVKDSVNKIYEEVYFKQGGELTSVNPAYFSAIGGTNVIEPDAANDLPDTKPGSLTARDPRANLILAGSGGHIGAITQVQKDGRRFIYGQPAFNHVQKEATFNVDPPAPTDMAAGLVPYHAGVDDAISNTNGIDQYYSSTITPPYAHSFLLTAVLSTDYLDVTGNGVTDDDPGSYTKFGYDKKESDYRWKMPFVEGKAQYDPGFRSEKRDDKGSYICGSRDEWMLSTIESKNFIAEFYTSKRNDAQGSTEAILSSDGSTMPYDFVQAAPASSYKLDSIRLYNKHDRVINGPLAVPIKTVYFTYDYALCSGVPNTSMPGGGKLTLRRIYFKYGNSQKSMMSPYQFDYGYNPDYNLSNKDRWGDYKPNNAAFTNYEYPYVNQADTVKNTYAAAWSLNGITLPSGGVIQAQYESNDYAFVQDKKAMEMFMVRGLGSGPEFNTANQLYHDRNQPFLYAYFDRRLSAEVSGSSFKQNYFIDQSCMYYNFNVKLTGKNSSYEQVKGYAEVTDVGPCSDGIHGYIKLKASIPTGGHATLNPITYTALNTGRYNVPQIIFPGSDPDESDFGSVLAGLKGAFGELVNAARSPIITLVKRNDAKNVNLSKSYVRLQNIGGFKKGGGQRVKKLLFFDSWKALSGGNEPNATYGKQYNYTIADSRFGLISSGVASYEPLIGGDENPFRTPVKFTLVGGSHWPPNDAADLYQETPIGESLYPTATIGYSKVTVSSINAAIANSAQGVEVCQFYTAKDFPIIFNSSSIDIDAPDEIFELFLQENTVKAKQGYSLVFNDMHGKPKTLEHYVYNRPSNTLKLISSQVFNYRQSGGHLDNTVCCLVSKTNGMDVEQKQLGVETDVTVDTRQKKEHTTNYTLNTNLNVSALVAVVIPIPLVFPWGGEYINEFYSATVTKITQQYGILDNVVSNNEGAITTIKNEVFDPLTGNVVVTSVNNEYHDKEYSVSIPAYWCYDGMGPAYANYNFEMAGLSMVIDTNYMAVAALSMPTNLSVGDQIALSYDIDDFHGFLSTWVMKFAPFSVAIPAYFTYDTLGFDASKLPIVDSIYHPATTVSYCGTYFLPRFPKHTTGWHIGDSLSNVHLTIIRPGPRNMLTQEIENYTMMDNPVAGGHLSNGLRNVVELKARTYCDSNSRPVQAYVAYPDTINPYAIGERGTFRLLNEYSYVADRNYLGTTARDAGLFHATSLFSDFVQDPCSKFPYRFLQYSDGYDGGWRKERTITKYSPNGKEVENMDALGIFSTAIYGYNQELPTAVASNASQSDVLADGFEDYSSLIPTGNVLWLKYSPIESFFSPHPITGAYSVLGLINPNSLSIVSKTAHTGKNALKVPVMGGAYSDGFEVPVPINNNTPYTHNRFNTYYSYASNFYSANEYLPFEVKPGKKYILSFWVNSISPTGNATSYSVGSHCGIFVNTGLAAVSATSNIIDGWQQYEVGFSVPPLSTNVHLSLPVGFYVDDLRIFPQETNIKSFVYNPINERLMATLDESNFASFFEYDQEGNLVRSKKETERGIMTVSESRKGNVKR